MSASDSFYFNFSAICIYKRWNLDFYFFYVERITSQSTTYGHVKLGCLVHAGINGSFVWLLLKFNAYDGPDPPTLILNGNIILDLGKKQNTA